MQLKASRVQQGVPRESAEASQAPKGSDIQGNAGEKEGVLNVSRSMGEYEELNNSPQIPTAVRTDSRRNHVVTAR